MTGRWSLLIVAIVWTFMVLGAALAWSQPTCEDTVTEPWVEATSGTINWRVPQGTLYHGGKAYCMVIVSHPADGRVLGLDYKVVQPCQPQTTSFPLLKGPATLEIRCSNIANEPGPSLTTPIKFMDAAGAERRWQYEVTACTCGQGFPVLAPTGPVLCAY